MLRILVTAAAVSSCAWVLPNQASACAVIANRTPSVAEQRRNARLLIGQATAIVDGEVVRALDKDKPALVYVYRTLKGPEQEWIQVGERHSCDVALQNVGERLRLILVGGPEIFFLPADYSNARAEDRILKSDRRKDWPWRKALHNPAGF